MKIAYFSPLPPQKSGISDYSEYLLGALMKHAVIDVWVAGFNPTSEFIHENFRVYDYVSHPELLLKLNEYDEIIYNIGNNPYYHSHIYDVFLKYNGIVILHEYVLYYLVTGYLLDYYKDSQIFLEECLLNHGNTGYLEGEQILASDVPPLQYKDPEKLPLNKRLIEHAKGIIVHSEFARQEVLKINPLADCIVISQIGPNPEHIQLSRQRVEYYKKKYKINDDDLIIASFGYVAPSKRIHQVIEALADIGDEKKFKYLLVGEGEYVKEQIRKYKLEKKVVLTGFTSLEEFDELIAFSDIVINLRFPYMGETSASLIRALLLGKVSIVSEVGWFSELPDEVVYKIQNDENEVRLIKQAIKELIENIEFRRKYERNALEYAQNNLNPNVIGKHIVEYIHSLNKVRLYHNEVYLMCDRVSHVFNEIDFVDYEEYIMEISLIINEL